MTKNASLIFGMVILAVVAWGAFWLIFELWRQIKLIDPKVSVAIFTASTTIIVATLTVVLGKQIERKREIEAHYREKKTEIYDEFLCEFFKLFDSDEITEDDEISEFLREWQRKMILWGGQTVLLKYIEWIGHLKKGTPDAKTMFLMEEFFLEIRKDLGHKNSKLERGTFIHLILQNPELFLTMAKDNPDLTLAKLAEVEKA